MENGLKNGLSRVVRGQEEDLSVKQSVGGERLCEEEGECIRRDGYLKFEKHPKIWCFV